MSMRGRFIQTVYGSEGETTPYLTRVVLGRLRLHIFWRGDADPDPHDHPWGFWTFPLTPYSEEVTVIASAQEDWASLPTPLLYTAITDQARPVPIKVKWQQIVPAWRISYRPATHMHRVMTRVRDVSTDYDPDGYWTTDEGIVRWKDDPRPIITIVWTEKKSREFGFLKTRDGRWCWVAWRDYVYGGGKSAPCEPEKTDGL